MEFKRIIQVEVTTACQASCTFCPRTVLKDRWLSKHIEWENFAPVLGSLKQDTLVHLQGWGEPLLHPRIWDMAAAVRGKKGRCSLTTNGLLLDEAAGREAVRIGLEFVGISLADADCAGHSRLRVGTDLDRISANVEFLCRLPKRPHVHIAVQMIKPSMEHLPAVVELAARLGADRVIASNLDCVAGPGVDKIKAFSDVPDPRAEEIVEEAKRRGRELRIEFEAYPLLVRKPLPVCSANPLCTTVITVSGEAAPCTYQSMPVQGDIPVIFRGVPVNIPRFVYGDAGDGIRAVLRREPAASFLAMFKHRMQATTLRAAGDLAALAAPGIRSIPGGYQDPGLRKLQPAPYPELPPVPNNCRYCYKLYGV